MKPVQINKPRQIDLRPHYAFAYFVESVEFLSKSLLYYNRTEKTLHFKFMSPIIDYWRDEKKDMERSVLISDEDAKALEKVFGLMIDALKAYKGDPWCVLDGCECVVICGRRRVRFDGPCPESPLGYFTKMADRLLEIMENWNQTNFDETIKTIPEIVEKFDSYISEKR